MNGSRHLATRTRDDEHNRKYGLSLRLCTSGRRRTFLSNFGWSQHEWFSVWDPASLVEGTVYELRGVSCMPMELMSRLGAESPLLEALLPLLPLEHQPVLSSPRVRWRSMRWPAERPRWRSFSACAASVSENFMAPRRIAGQRCHPDSLLGKKCLHGCAHKSPVFPERDVADPERGRRGTACRQAIVCSHPGA